MWCQKCCMRWQLCNWAVIDRGYWINQLSPEKNGKILHKIFSNAFFSMKGFVFWFDFHWKMFFRVRFMEPHRNDDLVRWDALKSLLYGTPHENEPEFELLSKKIKKMCHRYCPACRTLWDRTKIVKCGDLSHWMCLSALMWDFILIFFDFPFSPFYSIFIFIKSI